MIKNSPLIMTAGWVVLCLAIVLGSAAMIATPGEAPFSVPMPGNYIAMQKGVTDGMGAPWEAGDS